MKQVPNWVPTLLVQKLVARATWCPGFVHLCPQQQPIGLCNGDGCVVNEVGAGSFIFRVDERRILQ